MGGGTDDVRGGDNLLDCLDIDDPELLRSVQEMSLDGLALSICLCSALGLASLLCIS